MAPPRLLIALSIVALAAVACFAIYTFGWHHAATTTGRPHTFSLRAGDAIRVPAAATSCEVSHEAGIPNFFCERMGRRGRYQVVFWTDRVDLYDLALHGEPMVPTYSVPATRAHAP